MFSRKSHAEVKKAPSKVLDTKKDSATRLKHLRTIIDVYEAQDLQNFFEQNYSHIYYIYYDCFCNVELELKQRVNKQHKEELDYVLLLFEKILIYLPGLVHKKWQYHSIGRMMRKLLHSGNTLKIQYEGMRLFLIWYQILQDAAGDDCHEVFASLVPRLGGRDDAEYLGVKEAEISTSAAVQPEGITALLPVQPGEKMPENLMSAALNNLLRYMVSEVSKVCWPEKGAAEKCFQFLFRKFKQYYLLKIFSGFREETSIYNPLLDIPLKRQCEKLDSVDGSTHSISICKDLFVRWLTNFVSVEGNKKKEEVQSVITDKVDKALIDGGSLPYAQDVEQMNSEPRSNASTMSTGSSLTEKESTDSNSGSPDELSPVDKEIVSHVLMSSPENINLIHEVFRQTFLFSSHRGAVKKVIAVYRDWFQCNAEQRPVFMQEVDQTPKNSGARRSLSPSVDQHPMAAKSQSINQEFFVPTSPASVDINTSTYSYDSSIYAGLQNVLQVFITHSANVFLLDLSENSDQLDEQVELCKRTLNIYRQVVMNHLLDKRTWEQLLMVLLRVVSTVLPTSVPAVRSNTMAGRLAQQLFQTLTISWVRASLNVVISNELWDQLTDVLSSLTGWVELVREWAKSMESLTRALAKHVYNIDLKDLPLQRHSEQKEKKLRGMKPVNGGYHVLREEPAQPAQQQRARKLSDSSSSVALRQDGSRQRCHSGDVGVTNVLSNSTQQLSTAGLHPPASTTTLQIPRSNSDSSLMIDPDSKAGMESSAPLRMSVDLEVADDDHSSSNESLHSSEDGSQIPYLDIGEGKNSLYERNGSDTEMLLRVSDTDISKVSSEKLASLDDSLQQVNGNHSVEENSFEEAFSDKTSSVSPERNGGSESLSEITRVHSALLNGMPEEQLMKANESSSIEGQSLAIDDVDGLHPSEMMAYTEGASDDYRSILAGGSLAGWTPDSSVVLWRRMLGALGDLNKISDPEIHAEVYEYLCDLTDSFVKIRNNQSISQDKENSPPPPELVPPMLLISPWLFDAINLPDSFKRGRLLAYRLLCIITVRRLDIMPHGDYLTRFYRILHAALISSDKERVAEILRHAGPRYFSLNLPGNTLLALDFVQACKTILESSDTKISGQRRDAVIVAACLLCHGNYFGTMPMLSPSFIIPTVIDCENLKDHVIDLLIKTCKRELDSQARCFCVCGLMVYIYEELAHHTNHLRLHESIGCLLAMLMCMEKSVALFAADGLLLLSEHINTLLKDHEGLPEKIVEVIIVVAGYLLTSLRPNSAEVDKKLLINVIFVLLEWCMRLPLNILLSKLQEGDALLLERVFKLLDEAAVGGGNAPSSSPNQNMRLNSFWTLIGTMMTVDDVVGLNNGVVPSVQSPTVKFNTSHSQKTDYHKASDLNSHKTEPIVSASSSRPVSDDSSVTSPDEKYNFSSFTEVSSLSVEVAARTAISHLVNQVGHFPPFWGSARMTSIVQEADDIAMDEEAKSFNLLNSPHVQFFVYNNCTLLSVVEIPLPGNLVDGVTSGLTAGKKVTRLVLRDAAGKSCWDCCILYGPPKCRAGSYPAEPRSFLFPIPEDLDLVGQEVEEEKEYETSSTPITHVEVMNEVDVEEKYCMVPSHVNWKGERDNLDRLLEYIGTSSAECLKYPGEALNVPYHLPEQIALQVEESVGKVLTVQHSAESEYLQLFSEQNSLMAESMEPPGTRETNMDFHLCRFLVNQLGFLQKRSQFDLLRKSDKLLRDLKHLDTSIQCRETYKIAVFYVAEGQEDRQSILMNQGGSRLYENFVAGLGWEVDLESHAGFMGGLEGGKKYGESAPYYATSMLEVFFHVSTRMPSSTDEERHRKLRHLGNDEVHIIWSEHIRDYRRGIIPTDFGDVLIVIYPLHSGLFRIQIDRKPEVQLFGPLFDGAIVDSGVLSGLVRATAINASNALRSQKPGYVPYYEQRARYIRDIVSHNKDMMTFEEFTALVFAPVLPKVPRFSPAVDTVDAYRMPPQRVAFATNPPSAAPSHSVLSSTLIDSGIIGDMRPEALAEKSPGSVAPLKSNSKDSEASGSGFQRRFSFGKKKSSSKLVAGLSQPLPVNNNTLPYSNKSPTLGAKSKKV